MPLNIDPNLLAMLTGPVGGLIVTVGVLLVFRQDNNKKSDLDREERKAERLANQAEREKTQQLHKDSITELKEAFENTLDKVCKRSEETERLSEARFSILLSKTFSDKG